MSNSATVAVKLADRGVLAIAGREARAFLQGLVTNNLDRLGPERALYTALLSPQGKYQFDFFIIDDGKRLLIDCEAGRRDELVRLLTLYRLRAEVEIEDISRRQQVWAVLEDAADRSPGACAKWNGEIRFTDPRLAALGARAILPAGEEPGEAAGETADYEKLRLCLGVPDGSRDIEPGRQTFLEANGKELGGIDFEKGCYVGQEVTARVNYRGTLKKRLLPITFEGPAPAPGSAVFADGKSAGEARSGLEGIALALFRLEHLESELELEDGRPCSVAPPAWLGLDAERKSPSS